MQEPTADTPGHIYLWLAPINRQRDVLGYSSAQYEPRAYALPYSRALHEAVLRAQAKGRRGQPVVLEKVKPGHSGAHGLGTGRRSPYHTYVLPPAALPQKTGG